MRLLASTMIATAMLCGANVQAQTPGVTAKEVVIGQSVAYSGPAAAWGADFGKAFQAYMANLNAKGGINGRQVRVLSEDDAFTPPKAMENVRKLIDQDKVFAFVGNLGTPTNLATHRFINQKGVPNLFIMSGVSKWNDPKNLPMTTPFIPDYTIEGTAVAAYMRSLPDPKIALLSSNDDNGKEYDRALRTGLGNVVSGIVGSLTAEVTDPTVDSQIVQLAATKANVLFIGGTPRTTAQAIRKADELGWKPTRMCSLESIQWTRGRPGVTPSAGISSDWKDVDVALLCTANVDTILNGLIDRGRATAELRHARDAVPP